MLPMESKDAEREINFNKTKESLKASLLIPPTANLSPLPSNRARDRRSWQDSFSQLSQSLQQICGSPSNSPVNQRFFSSSYSSESKVLRKNDPLHASANTIEYNTVPRKRSLRRSDTVQLESSVRKPIIVRHYETQEYLKKRLSAICGVNMPRKFLTFDALSAEALPDIDSTIILGPKDSSNKDVKQNNTNEFESCDEIRITGIVRSISDSSCSTSSHNLDYLKYNDKKIATDSLKIPSDNQILEAHKTELFKDNSHKEFSLTKFKQENVLTFTQFSDNNIVAKLMIHNNSKIEEIYLSFNKCQNLLKVTIQSKIVAQKIIDPSTIDLKHCCAIFVSSSFILVRQTTDMIVFHDENKDEIYFPVIEMNHIEKEMSVIYRVEDKYKGENCLVKTQDSLLIIETRSRQLSAGCDDKDSTCDNSENIWLSTALKMQFKLPENVLPRTVIAHVVLPNMLVIKAKFVN